MAAHARLKNKFTEDEKYHNLMRWLIVFHFAKAKAFCNELNVNIKADNAIRRSNFITSW